MASNFWDLPNEERIKIATDATLKGYGVTVPVTTEESRNNLLRAQAEVNNLFSQIRALTWTGPVTLNAPTGFNVRPASRAQTTPIPQEVINLMSPYFSGYDLSGGTISNLDSIVSGLQDSINNIVNNPQQLPPLGAQVTYNPNNTTPPIGTTQLPPQPIIPTNSNPTTTTSPSNSITPIPAPIVSNPTPTTNPSQRAGSSTVETIAKVGLAVTGIAAVTNLIAGALKKAPANTNVTTTTNTTANARATTTSSPQTTTNPSNHLPLGNEIDDIYDPNLTPEQVASLNPGDQKARADALGYKYTGPAVNPGEIDPNTGDIIVTAPGQEGPTTEPLPPSPTALSQYDDWRVRLSLAPGANYLYRADDPKILAPLLETDGVIFPYTPQISVNYAANYEQSTIIHSNYRVYQYSNSSVDNVTITCDFTAQDTREANYLLAVIHFFRSVTKMFFGQDDYPRAGTPPPLCYLTGMGNYQFSENPLAITGFTYNLPNDVDYIKTVGPSLSGLPLPAAPVSTGRLPDNILPGGRPAPPDFSQMAISPAEEDTVTWVPTKIQLSITGIPIVSRNQMSQQFSLRDYASGALLNVKNSPDGGFW